MVSSSYYFILFIKIVMKKVICTFIAYILYYIGDMISIPMERLNLSFLWRIYTYVMRASFRVQIWGGASKPWE
jgi:hypothetical protein